MERRGSLRYRCGASLFVLVLGAASCTAILGIDKDYREGAGGSGGVGGSGGAGAGSAGGPSTSKSSSVQSSSSSGGMCAPPSCTGCADCQGCTNCAYTSSTGPCGTEYNACINNADCISLVNCLNMCGSPACQNACFTTYPGGVSNVQALAMCVAAACPSCN